MRSVHLIDFEISDARFEVEVAGRATKLAQMREQDFELVFGTLQLRREDHAQGRRTGRHDLKLLRPRSRAISRAENIVRMTAQSSKRLRNQGVIEAQEVPLAIELPPMAAADDKNGDVLVDLWARLLTTAMDPNRSDCLRLKFIGMVRVMDRLDALVLACMQRITERHSDQIRGDGAEDSRQSTCSSPRG